MTERSIDIAGLRIHLNADEDPVTVLRSLMRHVSNQEIADMLGISERTVRRWKHEGRLPRREHARLKLADLIAHLVRNGTAGTQQIGEIVRNGEARRRRRASANET